MGRFFARLRRSQAGIAMVEFAISLPVLLVLYVGGYVVSDAIACWRKVTICSHVLADLTTRYAQVGSSDLTTIMGASRLVLAPYDPSKSWQRITEVKVTDTTHATVIWSQASTGGTAWTVGTAITLPTNMSATNTYLILGETSYAYTPVIKYGNGFTFNFYNKIFMVPRLSDQVPFQ
jgi:Flp pilus assembly protein TadG